MSVLTPTDWLMLAPLGEKKILYFYLLAHASMGTLACSRAVLVSVTGLSEKQVRSALEFMTQVGWLVDQTPGSRFGMNLVLTSSAPGLQGGSPVKGQGEGQAKGQAFSEEKHDEKGQGEGQAKGQRDRSERKVSPTPPLKKDTCSLLEDNIQGEEQKDLLTRERAKAKPSAYWDPVEMKIKGFTAEDFQAWAEKFPGCDIHDELRKAEAWQMANPPKKNYHRFFTNWLLRNAPKVNHVIPPETREIARVLGEVAPQPGKPFWQAMEARRLALEENNQRVLYDNQPVIEFSETFVIVISGAAPKILRWADVDRTKFARLDKDTPLK
jgi:hypothetical protein